MSTDTQALQRLAEFGQSVWVDYLSRELMESGELARLVREDAVVGAQRRRDRRGEQRIVRRDDPGVEDEQVEEKTDRPEDRGQPEQVAAERGLHEVDRIGPLARAPIDRKFGGVYATGSSIATSAPVITSASVTLAADAAPPCASTMRRTSDRPSPIPCAPGDRAESAPMTKGSKARGRTASLNPGP